MGLLTNRGRDEDEAEWNRLSVLSPLPFTIFPHRTPPHRDKQHAAFLIAMGGLYPCPEVIEPILADNGTESKAILDIGTVLMYMHMLLLLFY